MGVRGLTTYIAKNSDKYLEKHELHDSYLVIDGNNLAAQLYKWHAKCYDCFGGDYDTYAKAVKDFFESLKKCSITPLIIFDGCYEDKKLRTIYSRVRNRVKSAQKLNAYTENQVQVFPLFLRELFTETVLKLGIKAIRCEFEADYEMACVARTLNCPILSYDSDFFIFDVLYIPFSTFTLEPRRIKKKTSSYYCIECKLYKIDNFLNSLGGMEKENLPLLAVLLGNDYIKMSVFSNFYSQLKLVKRKSLQSDQQRKIETIIKWLKNENYESAARKILGRIKLVNRKDVAEQIKLITDGYICVESKILPFFNIASSSEIKLVKHNLEIDLTSIEDIEIDSAEEGECQSETSETDSIEIDDTPSMVIDTLSNHFPEWFLKQYRTCNFPAWFLDIAVHNRLFFIPQLENYENKHSHHISLNIVAAIHKILTSGNKTELTYIARNEKSSIKNYLLETSNSCLPKLEDIENIDKSKREELLLEVLNLQPDGILNEFPSDWHTFILSLLYWVQNANPKVTKNHIYSIILSAITLKIVDNKIGYHRTLKQASKYEKNIEKYADNTEVNNITNKDCILFLKEMIPYFYMDEKMFRNPRIYDVVIVDAFSQFQSCLFHVKYLNKILNFPFEDFCVSDFYNGTLIYNTFANISKRTDAIIYIDIILKNTGGILKYFHTIIDLLSSNLNTAEVTEIKRRRKRKNRNKSNEDTKVICVEEKEENTATVDTNNPYSILGVMQ